jgi:hypothetical protein
MPLYVPRLSAHPAPLHWSLCISNCRSNTISCILSTHTFVFTNILQLIPLFYLLSFIVMPTVADCYAQLAFTPQEAQALILEGLETWDDFQDLTAEELKESMETLRKSTPPIVIQGNKRKGLLGMMHFCQDCVFRLDLDPDGQEFTYDLTRVLYRHAANRKELKSKNEAALKEASPGKLKGESSWETWKEGLRTYLSMLPGVRGVPLNYVIRENDNPRHDLVNWRSDNFLAITVECAPLTGMDYATDARQVHHRPRGIR